MKVRRIINSKTRASGHGAESPRRGRIQRLRTGHWIVNYPGISALLLACLVGWLVLSLLAAVPVHDYTPGLWPLFN